MARGVEEAAGGHRFNTDLLINPGDFGTAQRVFPHVVHVLDHAGLREAFLRFNRPANAAKRKGRIAGLAAIALGIVALLIAAASPNARAWGIVAAICGASSILVGLGGALYAGAKRRWLL